jgi:hypothetical protein
MNIINYKGIVHIFYNKTDENEKMFIDRTWYIVKNLDKYEDLSYLEKLSHIWVSQKYYNVSYDITI